jgi:hypothetical protein
MEAGVAPEEAPGMEPTQSISSSNVVTASLTTTNPQGTQPGTIMAPPDVEKAMFELEGGVVTVVRSSEELREAFSRNVIDIEIVEHLDLRGLNSTHNPDLSTDSCTKELGIPGSGCDFALHLDNTRSIRV